MGSRSSTSQQTQSRQDVQTSNLNLSDFEGIGIAGSEDVSLSIEQFDPGNVDIIRAGLNTSESIASDANNLAGQALRANQDTLMSGLDFGEDIFEDVILFGGDAIDNVSLSSQRATEAVSSTANRAVDASGDFLRSAFGFGGDALDLVDRGGERNNAVVNSAFSFVGDLFNSTTDTLSGAIGKAADATRSDGATVLNNVTKFGALAVGAIAVAFIISKAK